uniref:Immunoglobulin V-set domain-containing protein n=1 Tax=Oncorhynchus kisutch TaxID=8019 RepID=A0A8C7IU58_ONCKI
LFVTLYDGLFHIFLHDVFCVFISEPSAENSVFVLKGQDVRLNVQTNVTLQDVDVLFWKFNRSVNVVKYPPKATFESYRGRAEFSVGDFSLLLKNLQEEDSGLYDAVVSGNKDRNVAAYLIKIADVLKKLQNLDPYESAGLESCHGHPPLQRGRHSRPTLLQTHTATDLSILPCHSKVFESQVNKQITNHFESHRTFSTMQSGFRAGHGCNSATLKVLNKIITAIDKRQYCAPVFIDLAKAFDCQSPHSYRQTQQPWFLK